MSGSIWPIDTTTAGLRTLTTVEHALATTNPKWPAVALPREQFDAMVSAAQRRGAADGDRHIWLDVLLAAWVMSAGDIEAADADGAVEVLRTNAVWCVTTKEPDAYLVWLAERDRPLIPAEGSVSGQRRRWAG